MSVHMNVRSHLPVLRKKGEYPVDSDLAELMANSIDGSLATQLCWFDPMHECSICPTVWFALSVDPSDWGWNALDIRWSTPINFWR